MEFWHDKERDILIYPVVAPFLLQALPDAKMVGSGHFAVLRTLRNCQILAHYGHPVPPIMTEYDWPGRFKPYETQKLAANFMVVNPRCFNLSDMGVGKTNAALWAADFLIRQHANEKFKVLIISPLSTLKSVWGDAIFQTFLGKRTFEILHGDAEKRSKGLGKDVDFYLINHDGVGVGTKTRKTFEIAGFSKELLEREDIKLVIVDECSAYKDATTKRHRIARVVIGKRPYLFMMTGTPTPNAPTDAYGLSKLVNNAFGKSFTTFQSECMYKVGQFRWLPQKDGYDKAQQLLSPSIRIPIEMVWDAPPQTTQQREVEITDSQKKAFASLKKDLQVIMKSGQQVNAANEAAARQKFMQVSLGAIYDEQHKSHKIDASPRMTELKEIIEQAPAKLLIMVPLTNVLKLVHSELSKWSREMVYGDTSPKERARIFQDFETTSNPRILIADPRTLSHGLTLVAARTIVWFGATDQPEVYAQANKRCHRPGQKYPVTIVQIVSNPLEREIFRRLENNLSLQGALLDAIARGGV